MQRIVHILFILSSLFIVQPSAHSESVTQFMTKEEKIRQEMIVISRELGVTCAECHNVQNFRDNSKKNFKISKDHMKLTQMLKDNGFNGKGGPAATCYMCHRGKLKPDFKEPASAKTP
ncbi:MAG: hypothetical protein AAGB31_07125 [Bdellovibrio sp.]